MVHLNYESHDNLVIKILKCLNRSGKPKDTIVSEFRDLLP